jgi:RimJ/RimL family protein N-acetyltransferase
MKLEGKRIFLRPWKKSDVPRMVELCSDKTISRFTTVPFPYKKKHAEQYLQSVKKNRLEKTEFSFAIVLKKEKIAIGSVSLIAVDWKNRHSGLGYWLGKEFRCQGLATEAGLLLMEFGFKKLGLHRIEIQCKVGNKASKRVIEKLGFGFECRRKERGFLGGKFSDVFSFAILDREFFKGKKE